MKQRALIGQLREQKLSDLHVSGADGGLDLRTLEQRSGAVHLDLQPARGCNVHVIGEFFKIHRVKAGDWICRRHVPGRRRRGRWSKRKGERVKTENADRHETPNSHGDGVPHTANHYDFPFTSLSMRNPPVAPKRFAVNRRVWEKQRVEPLLFFKRIKFQKKVTFIK
jgi:hypothetical protein